MVASSLSSILMGFINVAILAGAILYAGIVLMSYRTEGPHPRVHFDVKDPARSTQRLLVWLGVRALAFVVRVSIPILGMLSEASAVVGVWFLNRTDPETQAAYRSRFLV